MTSRIHRSSDGYRQLMQQVIVGNGLRGLTATLARLTGCDAVVADEGMDILHCYDGTGTAADRTACELPAALRPEVTFSLHKAIARKEERDLGLDPPITEVHDDSGLYVAAAVLLSHELVGYIWARMAPSVHEPDDQVKGLVSEAAAACAVEFVRQQAMLEGEQRVRNSFLEDLLTGRLSSVSATRRRAKFLGYDLLGNHVVFLLDLDGFRDFVSTFGSDEAAIQRFKHRFRQAVEGWLDTTWAAPAMVWEHSDALVVLAPESGIERAAFLQRVETLRAHVQLRLAGPSISAGVGEPRSEMSELQDSFAEAEHAARIGGVVFGAGTTTAYRDLGVYRLLFHLRNEPELLGFCNETVGRLEAYDERHDGSLIETVQTYLELQGNVTRAAEALHLHRNGLLYRLNRIQSLAGISLDDPSDRLAIQLALLAKPLLKKHKPMPPHARAHLGAREEESA